MHTGERGLAELWEIELFLSGYQKQEEVANSLSLAGIAACLEVSVRDAIRKLVDHGEPYVSRIDKFKAPLKFDLKLTKALSDNKISYGEYIAHLLPVSSISHIISHLDALLGDNENSGAFLTVLGEIKEFKEESDPDMSREDLSEIDSYTSFGLTEFSFYPVSLPISDVSALLQDIEELLQRRHIIVHEASFCDLKSERFDSLIRSSRKLMLALYEIVEQILRPGEPRSPVHQSLREAKRSEFLRLEILVNYAEILQMLSSRGSERFSQIGSVLLGQERFLELVSLEANLRVALCRDYRNAARRSAESRVKIKLYKEHAIYLSELKNAIKASDPILL